MVRASYSENLVRTFYTTKCQISFSNFIGTAIDQVVIPIAEDIFNVPGRQGNATHDLTFIAQNIPPLGILNYYVARNASDSSQYNVLDDQHRNLKDDTVVLDNGVRSD